MYDEAGPRYEASLAAPARRAGGVFYTPADVAFGLVRVAWDGVDVAPPRRPTVCDPACGAGALLLAAADVLEAAGHDPTTIVEDLIWGADIDGVAVAVARASLARWAAERGTAAVARHVVTADSLDPVVPAWPTPPVDGFDLVVGNPPFQSQLATPTTRSTRRTAVVRERFGRVAAPYADSATLFLVHGCGLAARGGRVAMIQPESVLSARDAGPARRAVLEDAALVGLWWAGEPVFDAGVRVCAPILRIADPTGGDGLGDRPGDRSAGLADGGVRRWRGRRFEPVDVTPERPPTTGSGDSWSHLLGALQGTPEVDLGCDPTLATIASSSAGFRDEYYGVSPYVHEDRSPLGSEDGGRVRLVTSGLIDPLRCRWGSTTTRFARTTWQAPVVDLDGLRAADGRLAGWADQRLVPKVLLATQTRVIEAAVDVDGRWWPSVPTIAVVPRSGDRADLWRIAAALSAPATTAWALSRYGGAALSSGALKVSAAEVLGLPLPTDLDAWDAGAAAAEDADAAAVRGDEERWHLGLEALAESMADAYGVGPAVTDWWRARRPPWR